MTSSYANKLKFSKSSVNYTERFSKEALKAQKWLLLLKKHGSELKFFVSIL